MLKQIFRHVAVKCEAIMELEREIGKSSTFSCNRKGMITTELIKNYTVYMNISW